MLFISLANARSCQIVSTCLSQLFVHFIFSGPLGWNVPSLLHLKDLMILSAKLLIRFLVLLVLKCFNVFLSAVSLFSGHANGHKLVT